MKLRVAFLVWAGVMSTHAGADDLSVKSDLAVTVIAKNTSQIMFDASAADGKGDLFSEAQGDVLIHPASTGPYAMVPDRGRAPSNGVCAVSSVTPQEAKILVVNAAKAEAFDEHLALAVAEAESGFDVNAISEDGAYGLMQLMPGTAGDLGVDRCDPESNARGGVRYLKSLGIQFGNPVFALAAYNAGPVNVLRHKGVPPFSETIHYIISVLNTYYGSPTQLVAVAGAKPVRKVEKPDDVLKPVSASETAESKVWASGFVMHLN